jgi:F-type H+-transporting ATPase subunit O
MNMACGVCSQVDPSIIGGVIIDMADKHVDMSILSRIRRLQQLIRETVI